MNLLVGILCEDGVVVGAADLPLPPASPLDAAQDAPANTFVVQRDVILAGTGPRGLGQRFTKVVTEIRSDSRFYDWTGLGIAKTICLELIDDFASTRCERGKFGALIAFAACDGLQLCELSASDLQPELKTPQRWFTSMGAGRSIAESFLAFLGRALFADSPPGLDEAVFAATWVLDYTLGSGSAPAPGAVRIAVLAEEAPGLPPAARALSSEELSQQRAKVHAAEKLLAGYRGSLSGGSP